jgi:phospholipid/cholesterol/gamma-HCH transport system ATP-binding protein
MEIGENILLLHKGKVRWTGSKEDVLTADDPELDDFIFASSFLRDAKEVMKRQK